MTIIRAIGRQFTLIAFLAASLAGCTAQNSTPDDKIGGILVAPGKYEFYNCAQLAVVAKPLAAREKELRGLMVRAGAGAGGNLISSIAYQPDYYQVHGELNEVRRAAAAKNCKIAADMREAGKSASARGIR